MYAPSISVQGKSQIKSTIKNFIPEFNLTRTRTMIIEDGFAETGLEDLFSTMKRIVVESKNKD
jgi:hypothetical protein